LIHLTHYVNELLEHADKYGLEKTYRQALLFVTNEISVAEAPEGIRKYLEHLPGDRDDFLPVLYAFMEAARKKMNLARAEIFSAVSLSDKQLEALEKRLTRMFRRQLDITTKVDPSLLGGVRVIVDNTLLDDTVKRKLMDMKKSIYEGINTSL